jgi:sterol desaturase/sphingolipid hydroxylase (fatty acid hydroxylase superfamily)
MKTEELIGLAIPLIFALLLLVDQRVAARPYIPLKAWKRLGAVFLVLLLVIGSIMPLLLPIQWMTQHALLNLSGHGLWAVPLGVLATTFVSYWFHRAEHHFHPLWLATHQLHHSALRVDVAGAFFSHPLEIVINVALGATVAQWLLGMSPLASAALGVISATLAMFQHCNIHTPQWLGYLVQRPESHLLHHARDLKVSNFSDLPVWDMVFGTYNNPSQPWTGPIGITDDSPQQLIDMLLMQDIGR